MIQYRNLHVRSLSIRPLFYALLFSFNATATPEIYTLSLHDALPISARRCSLGPATARNLLRLAFGSFVELHPAAIEVRPASSPRRAYRAPAHAWVTPLCRLCDGRFRARL